MLSRLFRERPPEVVVVAVEVLVVVDETPVGLRVPVNDGGPNSCVLIVPIVLAPGKLRRLTPNWLTAARSTSANFTSSRISPGCTAGVAIKLVTLGVAFLTTSTILSATAADDACP